MDLFFSERRERKRLRQASQPLIQARFAVHYYEGYFKDDEIVAKLKSKSVALNFLFLKLIIAREHVATHIWRYQSTQLVYEICDAFAGVKLGNGVGMREAQCMDDYIKPDSLVYQQARADDERDDWLSVALTWWFDNRNADGDTPFSFMDAKGLYFHLPAWLVMGYDDKTESHFFKSLQEAAEGTTPISYRDTDRVRYAQFHEMLTARQKKVMLKILEREVDYENAVDTKRKKPVEPYFCFKCQRAHNKYVPMTKAEVIAEVENSDAYKIWQFFKSYF